MQNQQLISCDLCQECVDYEKRSVYWMRECKDHRVVCYLCYKQLITYNEKNKRSIYEIPCPCCKNIIINFKSLPCSTYEIMREFPFTI